MINIKEDNNQWRVEIDEVIKNFLDPADFPLSCILKNLYSDRVIWKTKLYPNTWATYQPSSNTKIIITTSKGKTLKTCSKPHHSGNLTDYLTCFIHSRNLSKGLILGAGNGEFGEWVPLANTKQHFCVLVEADPNHTNILKNTYKNYKNIKIIDKGVSTKSETRDFYIAPEGNVSSLLKENPLNYGYDKDQIITQKLEFIGINEILAQEENIDWVRIDIEGMDYSVITAIEDKYFDQIQYLQYEKINLPPSQKTDLKSFLEKKGFVLFDEKVNDYDNIAVKI